MRASVESAMRQLIETHQRENESITAAYPIVKSLCANVSRSIRECLSKVPSDGAERPQWWTDMLKLSDTVAGEPTNMLIRSSEIRGFLKGCGMTLAQIDATSGQDQRFEEKTDDLAQKIQSGEIDPEARRKVGQRPESLKNIRTAQAKISGSNN